VYEAPEIARVAAPVHLKTGNSVVSAHGQITSASDGKKMAAQASIVKEMLTTYYPDFKQSERNSPDLRIPLV
jgi:hypothetical protein